MSKLFSLYYGDYNNRSEFFRVKAYNIDQVIDWIKTVEADILNLQEIPKDKLIEDIDIPSEQSAYIMLNNCFECENYDKENFEQIDFDKCEYCEIGSSYIEIVEINDPDPGDYSFKVIYPVYGQDNYKDLTHKDEQP